MTEIDEAWLAFAVALMYDKLVTPETAAALLSGDRLEGHRTHEIRSSIVDIKKMREQGLTFRQIGVELGLDSTTAWKRLKIHLAQEQAEAEALGLDKACGKCLGCNRMEMADWTEPEYCDGSPEPERRKKPDEYEQTAMAGVVGKAARRNA